MNRILLVGVVSLAMIGCQQSTKPTTKISSGQVTEKIGEATKAIAEFTQQQKDEYLAKMNTELGELDKKLAAWKEKAKDATGDAKVKLDEQIQALEKHRETARKHLDDLKANAQDAWKELKTGLDKAISELKDGFATKE